MNREMIAGSVNMRGKKLLQFAALVSSVGLAGTYVYLSSRGTSNAPVRPSLQTDTEGDVLPVSTQSMPVFKDEMFFPSTKSFRVEPIPQTGSGEPNNVGGTGWVPYGGVAPVKVQPMTKEQIEVYFSSSKSGIIFDPKSKTPSQGNASIQK